jgi:hypothetical protein
MTRRIGLANRFAQIRMSDRIGHNVADCSTRRRTRRRIKGCRPHMPRYIDPSRKLRLQRTPRCMPRSGRDHSSHPHNHCRKPSCHPNTRANMNPTRTIARLHRRLHTNHNGPGRHSYPRTNRRKASFLGHTIDRRLRLPPCRLDRFRLLLRGLARHFLRIPGPRS